MKKTVLPVLIDHSCKGHPLLPTAVKRRLPAWTNVSLTAKKLFGYASMRLQDASNPKVATYQQVRSKADSMIDIFGHALAYEPTGIIVDADPETKGDVSELVGIAVGLAAACKVFRVNPNRMSRFLTNATGKRMDFEFTVHRRRYSLEVRGTTWSNTQGSMLKAVSPKKQAPSSAGFAAHAGAVTLYSQGGTDDHVVVVDPPGKGGESNELDELASVLEYYHNVYRLTHDAAGFCTYISRWLEQYRAGEALQPPATPTKAQRPRHRVSQRIRGVGTVRGTLFDRRILASSIAEYPSFELATIALTDPTWFLGTMPKLDEIVAAGRWDELLAYDAGLLGPDDKETHGNEHARDGLLASGVAVVRGALTDEETSAAAATFRLLRRQFERTQRNS